MRVKIWQPWVLAPRSYNYAYLNPNQPRLGFEPTHVNVVALTRELLKDAQPTQRSRCGNFAVAKNDCSRKLERSKRREKEFWHRRDLNPGQLDEMIKPIHRATLPSSRRDETFFDSLEWPTKKNNPNLRPNLILRCCFGNSRPPITSASEAPANLFGYFRSFWRFLMKSRLYCCILHRRHSTDEQHSWCREKSSTRSFAEQKISESSKEAKQT